MLAYPDESTSPEELVIPEARQQFPDGKKFLWEDSLYGTNSRLLIFSHPELLKELGRAKVVASDGTFKMRFPPKSLWPQLYCVHALVNDTFVLCALMVTTSKKMSDYVKAFSRLKELIEKETNGTPWEPEVS